MGVWYVCMCTQCVCVHMCMVCACEGAHARVWKSEAEFLHCFPYQASLPISIQGFSSLAAEALGSQMCGYRCVLLTWHGPGDLHSDP